MTKLQQKLVERARSIGIDVPDDVDFRRLYPGHWQRSAGAWSWVAFTADGRELMGSCYSMTELVKAAAIDVFDDEGHSDTLELIPMDEPDNRKD